jgi:hypothetical protein
VIALGLETSTSSEANAGLTGKPRVESGLV